MFFPCSRVCPQCEGICQKMYDLAAIQFGSWVNIVKCAKPKTTQKPSRNSYIFKTTWLGNMTERKINTVPVTVIQLRNSWYLYVAVRPVRTRRKKCKKLVENGNVLCNNMTGVIVIDVSRWKKSACTTQCVSRKM